MKPWDKFPSQSDSEMGFKRLSLSLQIFHGFSSMDDPRARIAESCPDGLWTDGNQRNAYREREIRERKVAGDSRIHRSELRESN